MSYRINQVLRRQEDFAGEHGVHICNLWQINTNTEQNNRKKDRRPTLADFAFSDTVQRVTHLILLLYRESFYHRGLDDGETEIIIAAQRGGGGTGIVKLYKDSESERLMARQVFSADNFSFF
jgi:replicative DNA helicase